jgi:hypothetical protein
MRTICCTLGFLLSIVLMPSEAGSAESGFTGAAFSCEASPTRDLLPKVVAPMTGASPAWMVDGAAPFQGEGVPHKTLWVLRRTSRPVRISGRRLDAPGSARLRYGGSDSSDMMLVANPGKETVVPGGAAPTVMSEYVFLPSQVIYPSPGCWEFTVQVATEAFRIVREIKPQG